MRLHGPTFLPHTNGAMSIKSHAHQGMHPNVINGSVDAVQETKGTVGTAGVVQAQTALGCATKQHNTVCMRCLCPHLQATVPARGGVARERWHRAHERPCLVTPTAPPSRSVDG